MNTENAQINRGKKTTEVENLMNIGDALFFAERYEEALEICEQLLHHLPYKENIYIAKGNVLNRLKRYQEALIAHQQAIRLNPNNPNAYFFLTYTLYYLGKVEEAKKAYKLAYKLGLETSQIGRGNTIWE